MVAMLRPEEKCNDGGAADTLGPVPLINDADLRADRVGVDIVKQEMGSDPASVAAFDTLQSWLYGSKVILVVK